MSHPNKLSTDFHRLLKTQDFKNKEELEAFMKSLVGKKIPEFEKEALSFEEQAEDLVMEAYEMETQQALHHVLAALEMDPDCIQAYEFLAAHQHVPQLALPYFAYGVELGRRKFKKELKEDRGNFWGIFETRPFMRCMAGYAASLHSLRVLYNRSLDVYQEILELNEHDNMGVRYQYGLCLLEVNQSDKFKALDEKFEKEQGSIPTFNRLLHSFLTKGDVKETIDLLNEAKKKNKFVIPTLLAKNEPETIPGSYSSGNKDEALYYAHIASSVWNNVEGSMEFLKKHRK